MIKNIMIIVVLLALAFLINTYYKKSSIKLENNQVILNVKDKSIFLDYRQVKSETLTFSNLNIVQNRLTIDGVGTFLEVATADALYQFSGDTLSVVKTIFKAKKVNLIFSINGLRAIEVLLENNSVVNLFVEDNNIKELIFFYGLSTDIFIKAIEKLESKEAHLLYQKNITSLTKPVTDWSTKHNVIDDILEAIDY